ncbi:MAG: efflux RND transporter periplasmic adaptor subunit [Planctomycetota bacterium]
MNITSAGRVDRSVGAGRRRLSVVVPILVLVSVAGVLGWSAWPVVRPAREVAVLQAVFDRSATVVPARGQDAPARDVPTVQAAGWLEAEPFYVACTALADGVVDSIEVLEGDFVERGEVVARLVADDSEIRLRRAEAEFAAADASLAMADAERIAALRSWEEPVELERAVETNQAALGEREAELAQLPSLVDSARATLTRLEEEAARVRRSTSQGATNEFERIVAEQRAAAQRGELAALEAREPILAAGVDRLRAELRAAERDLALRIEDRRRVDAAEAAVAGARASLDRARAMRDEAVLELERMVIRAPISGYVQRRLKLPGDKVIRMMDSPHSAHVLHVYDPERIQVRVDVPLAEASHVFVGQACEVVVEVVPDRVFRGTVLRTTHEADLQKNTLQMKVKVIDPDPILRPEMLTRVKFLPTGASGGEAAAPADRDGHRVLVPQHVLDETAGSSRVWVVAERRNGRGVLSPREVRIVERSEGWVTVVGDVQPGALVALDIEQARTGERVVVRTEQDGRSPS